MNKENLTNEEIFFDLLDGVIQFLKGFAEIFEAVGKIKKIEEKTGEQIFKKVTIEELIERLSREDTIEILSKDPGVAQTILKLTSRVIKVVSLLNKIDLDRAKADELLEITADMNSIINDIKSLREKMMEIIGSR